MNSIKIYLTLAALCMALLCSAQVTEKDLLGRWQIKAVATKDYYVDVEIDSVTIPNRTLSGEEKMAVLKRTREYIKGSYMLFKPGLKTETKLAQPTASIDKMTLIEKDRAQYFRDYGGMEYFIYIKEGFLYMYPPIETNEYKNVYFILSRKTD